MKNHFSFHGVITFTLAFSAIVCSAGCEKNKSVSPNTAGSTPATAAISDKDVTGIWKVSKAEYEGGRPSTWGSSTNVWATHAEIRPDHTYDYTNPAKEHIAGTWTLKDSALTLTPRPPQNAPALTLTIQRPYLVDHPTASMTLTYEKQFPAPADIGVTHVSWTQSEKVDVEKNWPPVAADWLAKKSQNSKDVKIDFQDQSPHYSAPDIGENQIALFTVLYYHDSEFLGIFQRFEEENVTHAGNEDVSYSIPKPPSNANSAILRLIVCSLPQSDEQSFPQWYANSWRHFTTATDDHGSFKIWTRPTDTDLQAWLLSDGIKPTAIQQAVVQVDLKP